MNKKMVFGMVLVVAALAVSSVGVAFAQGPQAGVPAGRGPLGQGGVEGPLHDYMINAMADALGIAPSDFEARHDAGQTAYQIALDLGISADKIPALLSGARSAALDKAVADGVITQQQADWMKSRGAGMGTGNCTGNGQGMGPGAGRGMRWQQANP